MTYAKFLCCVTVAALGLGMIASGHTQQPQKTQHTAKAAARPAKAAAPAFQPGLEPRAIDVLKAACARLAAARSMAFTAVVSYESPSRLRPDKLKVITLGDGPPSEFYYDGKAMMAYEPADNLVAVADAPPTIDAALQLAYDSAAIYFPFTDVVVANPYTDIADGLKVAFYIGQSRVVGDTTTDMVAYITGDVFVQIWIGTQDKLPRRIYAVYLNDRTRLRHVLELSNWQLDVTVPANAFASAKATGAAHIAFARPDETDAPGMKPPPKTKPPGTQ